MTDTTELPADFGPAVKQLAEIEGVRPPGLESDPELVAQIAADIKAGREAGSDQFQSRLVFSTRGRLIDGWTRVDVLLSLDITEVGPADYVIDYQAVDDDTEMARAMYWQLARRNLPDSKRQRAAWAGYLRDEQKLSQTKLAKLFGVSQAAVSQWFSEFPEFGRKEAATVVGIDGRVRTSPKTTAKTVAKKAAAKAWTPPFAPDDDDPSCPVCERYGDDPCVNPNTYNDLKRWHSERIDDVAAYREVRGNMVPIPSTFEELGDAPECPECGRKTGCWETGYDFPNHWHPARLEAWGQALEESVRAEHEWLWPRPRAVDLMDLRDLTALIFNERFDTDAEVALLRSVHTVAELQSIAADVERIANNWNHVAAVLWASIRDGEEPDAARPCSTCGAVGDDPCVNPKGKALAKPHAKRQP